MSCGAAFLPPDNESRARNKLLHSVTSDVNKLRTFCSVLTPTLYALGVRAARRHEPARLDVLTEPTLPVSPSVSDILEIAQANKDVEEVESIVTDPDNAHFHHKAHVAENAAALQGLEQFPWRNPAFTSGLIRDKQDWASSQSDDSDLESVSSVKSVISCSSSGSSSCRRRPGRVYNQWIYKECRFFLVEQPSLVLTSGLDGVVELAPFDKHAAEQCWTLDETLVYSSNGQALTVAQRSVIPPAPLDPAGCRVKVAPLQLAQNGNSHQQWRYNPDTGHLVGYACSALCSRISAALTTGLCTWGVTGSDNAEQPTYLMENPRLAGIPRENTHIYVCGSCASALRDRYSVEKVDPTPFVCSVGYYCGTGKLTLRSSMVALGGLQGLDEGRAFGTLYMWESVLGELKGQTSLSGMKEAVQQALKLECPNEGLVLVRCYLNGTGPPAQRGALFLARSLPEILRKCLLELHPPSPLSRIFLADGTEITSFRVLLNPDAEQVPYKELFVSAGEAFVRPKRPRGAGNYKRRLQQVRALSGSTSLPGSGGRAVRPPHLPRPALPVLITSNGDFTSLAVRVVASSLDSLLETATSRLNLATAARRAFSCSGARIESWGEVTRDQAIVVSSGEPFVRKGRKKWLHRQAGK